MKERNVIDKFRGKKPPTNQLQDNQLYSKKLLVVSIKQQNRYYHIDKIISQQLRVTTESRNLIGRVLFWAKVLLNDHPSAAAVTN